MDPEETLRDAVDGLDADDDQLAVSALNNYAQWVSRGGYPASRGQLESLDTAANAWVDRWDTTRAARLTEIATQSSRDPRGGMR